MRERLPGLGGATVVSTAPVVDECDVELRQLKEKIQRERGFNCLVYKDKCLRRRILVRMRSRGKTRYAAYAELLDQDPREYEVLIDTLTINVTKFFRNLDTWRTIEHEVVPALFAFGRSPNRIWSAGCSSGEEPYSLSILLHEHARRLARPEQLSRFRIDATDIDRQSLVAARRAEYPELSLLETPQDLRERWFSAGPPFRLRQEAQALVQFRHHDLISDPPSGGYSLILCRNVIIYFDREVQERIFQTFHRALVPGGYLVLGKVETLLGATRGLFQPVQGRERIFRKPA